jgi:Zn-finger nucleic acid-binding protein
MKCPRCKTPDLAPTLIEEYLPAMGCGTCQGSLVSLLYYRHWAETQKVSPAAQTAPPEAAHDPVDIDTDDSTSALSCPKCGRFMTKYKVSGRVSNRLDVCNSCDEAWLDRGEWELLESLQLSHQMPAILTDEWQRRIRHELSEETRRSILARTIGVDAATKVEEFRTWLSATRHKSEIMVYLYRA